MEAELAGVQSGDKTQNKTNFYPKWQFYNVLATFRS